MGFLSRKSLKLESLEKRELFSVSTAPGVGWAGQGADLEYVDLNNNGVDDVIAMAYDAPSRSNHFRFRIGYDVNANGEATRWSDIKYGPSLGWEGQGFSDVELETCREWLRSKANSIEGGTTEINLNVVAKRVLGLR